MTLFTYIFRQYSKWFFIVLLSFSSIVILFDYFELFRRSRHKAEIGFGLISKMVFFHYPDIIKQLMPLVALFSSLVTFWKLGRSSQLVIMRVSGASIWRLIFPLFVFLGLYTTADFLFLNNLSAQFMQKFEQHNTKTFKGKDSHIRLSSSGLWLREGLEKKYAIVQIKNLELKKRSLNKVSFFIFSNKNNLVERIEARQALLKPDGWFLKDVDFFVPNRPLSHQKTFFWPTHLDLQSIETQFWGPDTIPFWQLSQYITILQEAGLSTIKHEMQWHTTLSRPLLLLTMAFLGAFISFWVMQRRMKFSVILLIISFAYLIYVLFNVVGAMGQNHSIPLFLSAWAPPLMSLFFSAAMLLHFEERV